MKTLNLLAPTSWSDITLKQYRFLLDAQRRYNLDDPTDQLEFRVEQISILNPDIPVEDIKRMTIPQATVYFKEIDLLFDTEPVKEEVKDIEVDGKKYSLINFKHLTFEGWIDGEKYSDILNIHKLIAIFYINPNEYNNIDLEKVADWFDNQPVTKSFYLISQFFFIQKLLEKTMELYTEKVMKETEKMKKTVERVEKLRNKFSFKSSTTSRIMTWLKLKKSLE